MSNNEQKPDAIADDLNHDDGFDEIGDENDQPQRADNEQNSRNVLPAAIVTALLTLSVVLGGGYYWYHNFYAKQQQSLVTRIDSVSERQQSLQTALDAVPQPENAKEELLANQAQVKSELSAKIQQLTTTVDGLKNSQQQLQQSLAKLYTKKDDSSLAWVLAEAEYLVLAASQRLALEGDINTAIAALKAADQRLGSADHPDLIPVRDQIIEDVTALEAVKLPDIEGLAIYLAKVIPQVKDLPTKQITASVEPFSGTKGLSEGVRDWRNVANAVWSDLVELVEVKDAALPDSVLFDPELKYFLQQNLRLELASARLSALRRDGENFRASVSLVKDMLNDFYDTSATKVSSIMARLGEAQAYEFEPALPKITGSLDVIRAQIKANASSGAAQ